MLYLSHLTSKIFSCIEHYVKLRLGCYFVPSRLVYDLFLREKIVS